MVFETFCDLAPVIERDGVGEHPRLRRKGSRGVAQRPESFVAFAGGQARGQSGKLRPEVFLDALVGEVDDLRHRDAKQVEGHSEGYDVEVPDGDNGLVSSKTSGLSLAELSSTSIVPLQ